jgi:S1-C subfamily serine protease
MKYQTFIVPLLVSVLGLVTLGNCQEKSNEEENKGKIQNKQEESDSVNPTTTLAAEMDSTGFVGIYITENENGEGSRVDDVVPDGPAANAGIKKGDIIIELEGKKIPDEEFLLKEIGQTKPGQKVNFKIKRKEKIIQITVETTTRPKSTAEETPAGLIKKIGEKLRGDKNYLGIKTVDIMPGLDEYFNVESGALIIEVMKNSLAEKLGIKPGDVIVGIDETNVPDSRTLRSIMEKKQIGTTVTIKLIRHTKTMMIKGILESE